MFIPLFSAKFLKINYFLQRASQSFDLENHLMVISLSIFDFSLYSVRVSDFIATAKLRFQ